MSQTVITLAFEQLKAQQAANGGILTMDEFVFANVPNLNITDPIDRDESWPDASQIVYRQAVSKTGMVNNNAVVYSVVLGAETGDFEFNWIGLANKASNTVCMIVHSPLQKKIKTASGQQGNVLTRSFLMEFDGASQQTQIITPVDTWQIDFTARLAGVDERARLENIDIYGNAGFIGEGFLVTAKENAFSVKKGVAYIAGLRAELLADLGISASKKPVKVWADVCWRGTLTSAWDTVTKITVAETLASYSDNGEKHYVCAVAEIAADGTVTDLRPVGSLHDRYSQPLNPLLTAISRLNTRNNQMMVFDGKDSAVLSELSEFILPMLAKQDAIGVLDYLGAGGAASMGVATADQMKAGTSDTLLPSVAAVMSLFNKRSFAESDFIRIPDVPGGLIIQWGKITSDSLGDATWIYPTPFPKARLTAWGIFHRLGVTGTDTPTLSFNNVSDQSPKIFSNFQLRLNGVGGPYSAFVFSIGY